MGAWKIAFLFLAGLALAGCAAGGGYRKKTGPVAKYQGPRYQGPLFDAMAQIDEKVDHEAAMAAVRKNGVKKMALFARSRKFLGMNELYVVEIYKKNPDLLILGAPKYFQLDMDLGDDYINKTVEGIEKFNYAFVGEILYTHADKTVGKQTGRGERYVDPDNPGTRKFVEALKPFSLPIMTHWEFYAWERDWPRFSRLYAAFPDQVFIIPHCGFGSAKQVETILAKHSNVYMTLSKKPKVPDVFADSAKRARLGRHMLAWPSLKLRPAWRKLLVKYSHRLMFATDPHIQRRWREKAYSLNVALHRIMLAQLPKDVADNLAFATAEKVYGVKLNGRWRLGPWRKPRQASRGLFWSRASSTW